MTNSNVHAKMNNLIEHGAVAAVIPTHSYSPSAALKNTPSDSQKVSQDFHPS